MNPKKANEIRMKKLSEVFAKSMYEDPMYYYIFNDWELNQHYFTKFWQAILKYSEKFGSIITTADDSGVLCLLPPDHINFSFLDLFRTGFKIPRSISRFPYKQAKITFDIMMKLGVFQTTLIKEPHWYLISLGVLPEEQGKGKGKSLLTEALRIVDEDNKSVYLETETIKNVNLYEKFGFKTVKEIAIKEYGLTYYLMLRDSQN
ncbi:MAG: GNAT family N-acetyltransferase [Anaerolineae bacterium]|nr:GNAT family N-acetyltransferase [Anaerolineae bacterium]